MQKDPRTFDIIGAAMEVHRELGAGFLEAVYQEAFARELAKREIPFRAEVELPVFYKGERLSTSYRADFVCFDSILVEIKALGHLSGIEEAQVINYLKATGHSISLLLNFGGRSLEYKRLALSPRKSVEICVICGKESPVLDLVLRSGTVFDGTGAEGLGADIGIQGEWIREIGDLSKTEARRTLECAGLYVTPGFIDMHTHSDLDLFVDPGSSPKVRMGVTLEVLGQDGISVAPMRPENVPQVKAQLSGILGDHPIEWRWQRVGEYLRLLHRRTTVNVSYLVPHGALRWWVMGFEARTATPPELDAMCALLRESVQEGAVGISTGLLYPPCIYADWDELVALARTTARAGGFWVVHIRNEGDRCLESVQEMLDLSRASGCPLHISHFKVTGRDNFPKADRQAEMVAQAIREGLDVTCDQYPYTAGCTVLGACLPPWAHAGGVSETLKRLANPTDRARMREEMEAPERGTWPSMVRAATYDGIVIATVVTPQNQDVVGKSLAEIARMRRVEPAEALFTLLLEEGMKVTMIIHHQSEEVVAKYIRLPFQTFGTDGIRGTKPHPRLYGTFPRALGRYVREQRLMSWADAIRRMTGAAAKRLGVSDQGLIRVGVRASITVFDPERIMDRATYEEPKRDPEGIRYVLVNGQIALENGIETGVLAGRVCSQTWYD